MVDMEESWNLPTMVLPIHQWEHEAATRTLRCQVIRHPTNGRHVIELDLFPSFFVADAGKWRPFTIRWTRQGKLGKSNVRKKKNKSISFNRVPTLKGCFPSNVFLHAGGILRWCACAVTIIMHQVGWKKLPLDSTFFYSTWKNNKRPVWLDVILHASAIFKSHCFLL